MVFKLIMAASKTRRRLKDEKQLPKVIESVENAVTKRRLVDLSTKFPHSSRRLDLWANPWGVVNEVAASAPSAPQPTGAPTFAAIECEPDPYARVDVARADDLAAPLPSDRDKLGVRRDFDERR
jgi:hypothetical protein